MFMKLKWLRWILLPFGILHLSAIQVRRLAYQTGLFKKRSLPVPVISVGNIQAGGTGKTPFILFLIQQLQDEGLRVGVLSRGYGRKSQEILAFPANGDRRPTTATAGDEPMEIWPHLNVGGMGIGADRHKAGLALLNSCELDCFLLDDGLQHQRLVRDLDICLIDVSRWQSHPFLLPFSYLRDTKNKLQDVQWIMLNKWNAHLQTLGHLESELERYSANVRRMQYSFADLTYLNGKKIAVRAKYVGMICGIANPGNFADMLIAAGYVVVWQKHFADHHAYALSDVSHAWKAAKAAGAELLLTTEKDAVKLRPLLAEDSELAGHFAIANLKIEISDEDQLLRQIMSCVGKSKLV